MYFWMGLPKYVFNKNADFALEDWPGSLAPRVPAVLPAFDRVTGSRLRSQEHVVGSLLSLCAPAWGLLPARTRRLLKDVWNRHCVARAIATAALRLHCCLLPPLGCVPHVSNRETPATGSVSHQWVLHVGLPGTESRVGVGISLSDGH